MTRRPRVPKYLVIKQSLLEQIRERGLKPGDQVISIIEIMERFQVSKVTAVRSLAELEKDGIIRREQGRGTFVATPDADAAGIPQRTAVGIVVASVSNPFYMEVVKSLERHLRQRDLAIEFSATDYDADRERETVQRLIQEGRVAGILILSWMGNHRLKEVLTDLPVVFIDTCPPRLRGLCSLVASDNYRGGFEAASYLASIGHQRIGYLNLPIGGEERLVGFREGLQSHGLWLDGDCTLMLDRASFNSAEVIRFIRERKLTAVFAVNDMTAIQVMHALRLEGYQIPTDISVMGYDNIDAAEYLDVPLTTMEQHEREIGRKAVDVLLESLADRGGGPRPAREVIFIPRLIVRASTGPPALLA
jgi:DNA-binding LacI/PurR family transcriptional regulator